MISMQGSALRKAQAKHLKQTASGWHICFPRNHTDAAMVALHTTVPYLGIQLSYKTLQTSTLQHRLQCGLRAFQRLRTWLCSKRGLTCKQRESLWCSVVRTTTLYGVQVIGCSPAGLRRLLSRLTIQQRMFMQDHSHVMHRSHREFHELFDIEPPAVFLRRLCIRTLRGGADRLANLEATDILHTVRYTETDRLISLLDDWIVSQARGVDVIRPAFQCRTCLETFNSAILLTKHEHQIHSRGRSRCFQFRLDRDARAGHPQCRHCDKTFQSWTNLRTHVEFGNCPMFDAAQVGMDLGQLQQRAAPLIQEHSLDALAQTPDVCTYMMNHCILCGKHQSRFSDMVHHLQLDHCTYALASQHHYSKWATARRSPCNVCQHDYKTSHQCKILLQASVLHQWLCHLADAPASHAYPIEDDQDLADHLCVHCAEIFSSDTALERHLREDHSRFCCIRDTVHGTTVCRHCRSHFGEQWELRRHIDRGSCDHLDPMGDQEPGTVLRLDDIFMDQIKAGKWAEALQDSSMRHKLTMTCSFCGQAYARTADLIRHLQCHHGGFFRAADSLSCSTTTLPQMSGPSTDGNAPTLM